MDELKNIDKIDKALETTLEESTISIELLIKQIEAEITENVNKWHEFYKRNADSSRFMFRVTGLIVIFSSISIPVLSVLEFPYKNLVVALLGVCIALMT